MSIQVVTITRCDKCGLAETRESVWAEVPVNWAKATLLYSLVGTNDELIKADLCPNCAMRMKEVL